MMKFDVRPGVGVGALTLGAAPSTVDKLLGAPERVEKDDDDEYGSESWHYDQLGISLHFDGESNQRLDSIDASSLEVEVKGLRPIGLQIAEAKKLFGERVGLELDAEYPDTDRAVYDLPGLSVSLWFDGGFCDSVQTNVPIDAQGNYVWPPI
jgi:hypothetical protein